MEVKNAVMPNEDQIKGFSEQGGDKPIYMVNLLKFKEKASYPDKKRNQFNWRRSLCYICRRSCWASC